MSTGRSKGEGSRFRFQRPGGPSGPPRQDFEHAYTRMIPAWDIGRPQQPFLDLLQLGEISGKVLDVGCGTGEHVLMAGEAGLEAVGIDISPTAISLAESKMGSRGVAVKFLVRDALRLDGLGGPFDTVLDCGLFHNLDEADRLAFSDSLRAVLRPGGNYFMFCFSGQDDQGPRLGPARAVSTDEIRAIFRNGFHIESIESARLEENLGHTLPAWLAKITRTEETAPGA